MFCRKFIVFRRIFQQVSCSQFIFTSAEGMKDINMLVGGLVSRRDRENAQCARLSAEDENPSCRSESEIENHIPSASVVKSARSYEDAINDLNSLQTNASVLHLARKMGDRLSHRNIPSALMFAKRAGVTLECLKETSIIHVSGTKGKGSTCAFCESIMRKNGLKTGFFSSPHLVEVRERIRINGFPLERQAFADYFYDVFNPLVESKPQFEDSMPAYFRFLTIMALNVFLKEKVDVAIMEVGVGGEYDCTNIIPEPIVVGIASLGLDHTDILGNSISKIAWHKAGICKAGRPAYTVPQPEDGLKCIIERALEKKATIQVIPSLQDYDFGDHSIELGLAGEHQWSNAALALQLCKRWMEETRPEQLTFKAVPVRRKDAKRPKLNRVVDGLVSERNGADSDNVLMAEPFVLPESFITGLRDCYWAGRNQTFRQGHVTFYIDGAHTPRSIAACKKWFVEASSREAEEVEGKIARILIFNSTGNRDSGALIRPLLDCNFHGVVFCPNQVSAFSQENTADLTNRNTTCQKQLARCQENYRVFEELQSKIYSGALKTNNNNRQEAAGASLMSGAMSPDTVKHSILEAQSKNQSNDITHSPNQSSLSVLPDETCKAKCITVPSINDALQWATCAKDGRYSSPRQDDAKPPEAARLADRIQILVTGSIHLVGGVIKVISPELALNRESTKF